MTRGIAMLFLATLGFCESERADAGTGAQVSNVSNAGTPILVELFTSEGCSSCPPADVTVARLEKTQPVAGARVIVLAHHVDYWNQLGWPDPFSSAAATERQRAYGKGTYTPEAIIDGNDAMVGSNGSAIEAAVATAAKTAHLALAIDVTTAGDVTVRGAPADASVLIAVVQDRGRVKVPKGENAGQTLDHTAIVRSLTAGPTAHVTLPAATNAPDGTTFSIVAFASDRTSRRVLGTASVKM